MIKIAKASAGEAAKIKEKKRKAKRSRDRAIWKSKSEEEQQEILEKRNRRYIKDEVNIALWDFKKNQYPATKYGMLRKLLKERITEMELEKEEFMKIKPSYEDVVQYDTLNSKELEEIKKVQKVIEK